MDTNLLTEEILALLEPRMVLIAYENKSYRGDTYYLEMRPIGRDGTMGAGVPVTHEFLREISETYSGKNDSTPAGAIPANLLYVDTRKGSEKYVWWNPPRRRRMLFTGGAGIADGEYHVPGVVYVAGEGRLTIYAFKGAAPALDAELFEAPFFNTSGGSVCLGTSTIKRPTAPTFEAVIGWWEDRFWLSKFSHAGGNSTRNGIVAATLAAADSPFDTTVLKSANRTLNSLLK